MLSLSHFQTGQEAFPTFAVQDNEWSDNYIGWHMLFGTSGASPIVLMETKITIIYLQQNKRTALL